MKGNLPEKSFFDSFYIWFNKEKREEYYSTPLYLYSVNRKDDFENRLLTLFFDNIFLNTISGVSPFPVLYTSQPSNSDILDISSVDTKYNDPHPIVAATL